MKKLYKLVNDGKVFYGTIDECAKELYVSADSLASNMTYRNTHPQKYRYQYEIKPLECRYVVSKDGEIKYYNSYFDIVFYEGIYANKVTELIESNSEYRGYRIRREWIDREGTELRIIQ